MSRKPSAGVIKSISYDQSEILNWIIELYLGGEPFELDPTYSTGQFYKHGVPEPDIRSDISPQCPGCMEMDVRDMVFPDESIRSCIFDPPFLVATGPRSIIKDRFSDCTKRVDDMWKVYEVALREIYRVLRVGGVLAFKCQDLVSSGKQWWTHIEIHRMAVDMGLKVEDLFIFLSNSRMMRENWTQRHARKFHSYFWVFRKV